MPIFECGEVGCNETTPSSSLVYLRANGVGYGDLGHGHAGTTRRRTCESGSYVRLFSVRSPEHIGREYI